MTSDRYKIVSHMKNIVADKETIPRDLLLQLRKSSRDTFFIQNFDKRQFEILITDIFLSLTDLIDQLDVIATIANILYLNEDLRNTKDEQTLNSLFQALPHLSTSLSYVSERQINSESQYKDFLPIFRLYFLMAHNVLLLPNLKESILKISGKLLNFVALSSAESINLNIIIIEILKTMYTYVHQVEDPNGIDSSFVLSCNKFQSLYTKSIPNKEYDEILQHFGNVLITIPTEISQNYMLNKLKFAQNEVTFLNKLVLSNNISILSNSPTTNILTLDVLVTIDNEDSGVRSYINEHLNLERLFNYPSQDPNLPILLKDLKHKLENFKPSSVNLFDPPISSPTLNFGTNPLESVLGKVANDYKSNTDATSSTVPRFENLTEEEQDEEIKKVSELFEKIEKNGIFKLKMK